MTVSKLMYAWCQLTQWDVPDCDGRGGVRLACAALLRLTPQAIIAQSTIVACASNYACVPARFCFSKKALALTNEHIGSKSSVLNFIQKIANYCWFICMQCIIVYKCLHNWHVRLCACVHVLRVYCVLDTESWFSGSSSQESYRLINMLRWNFIC